MQFHQLVRFERKRKAFAVDPPPGKESRIVLKNIGWKSCFFQSPGLENIWITQENQSILHDGGQPDIAFAREERPDGF